MAGAGGSQLAAPMEPTEGSGHLSPSRPSASGQINLQEGSGCSSMKAPSGPVPKGGIPGTQEIRGSGGISSGVLPAAPGLPPPPGVLGSPGASLGGDSP